jgi:hypothetical protein
MLRPILARILLWSLGGCLASPVTHGAGIDWPADRLLPSFSQPASVIDCIDITSASGAEVDLFTSLEGIVNRAQPRLACVSGKSEEAKFTWMKIHHLPCHPLSGYNAVAKYQSAVTGLVVTDPKQPATLDLATTIAGLKDELICNPNLLATLTNAPCQLTIKDDLRGRFSSPYQVYQCIYSNYWPQCTHRVIAGLSPHLHGFLRDYLVAIKGAAVWLSPGSGGEDTNLLARFIGDMTPAHGVYMGWWPSEADGLGWIGQYGIPVLASDFFQNGSLFGGVAQPLDIPPIPPLPPLENKIYVALILSDGDNVQYMQHALKLRWSDPARGSVPIGWTVSPLSVDLDPGMLDYYQRTATTNDCLVSGPSGAGYARLNHWTHAADLAAFTKISDGYLRRSGLRIITVWNKITPAIADDFAANCPTLLGLTDQSGNGYATIHSGLPIIGFAAHANYAGTVKDLLHSIAKSSAQWHGTAPMFIAVQGDVWYITPSDCRKIADSLDKNKYVVVRPDHLFMLFKQAATKTHTTSPTPPVETVH